MDNVLNFFKKKAKKNKKITHNSPPPSFHPLFIEKIIFIFTRKCCRQRPQRRGRNSVHYMPMQGVFEMDLLYCTNPQANLVFPDSVRVCALSKHRSIPWMDGLYPKHEKREHSLFSFRKKTHIEIIYMYLSRTRTFWYQDQRKIEALSNEIQSHCRFFLKNIPNTPSNIQ